MEERISDLMAPDTVISQQFFDTLRRNEPLEPEKALLVAILEDAIHNYRKYSFARDRVGKGRFHEAEHWIMHSKDHWIFSFENVCDLLGLDPEYLRRGLRDWRATVLKREKHKRSPAAQKHGGLSLDWTLARRSGAMMLLFLVSFTRPVAPACWD